MPPANSPNESPPPASTATSPYLQQLEAISSPVPNFAATLTTPSEQEANDVNVSFLRTRLSENRDQESEGVDIDTLLESYTDDYDHWTRRPTVPIRISRRLSNTRSVHTNLPRSYILRPSHRSVERLDMSRQAGDEEENGSYTNRTPHRQSLYDWAPYIPISDDDGNNEMRTDDLEEDLPSYASYARYRWLERRQHLDQSQRIERNEAPRPTSHHQPRDEPSGRTTLSTLTEALRNETASRRESQTSTRALLRSIERQTLSSTEAVLRSVDRHRRSQSRAQGRSPWQSYVTNPPEGEENATTTSTRLHRSEQPEPPYRVPDMSSDMYIPSSRSALRQKFLENSSLSQLRKVMKYLSGLRHCSGPGDALALSKTCGISSQYEGHHGPLCLSDKDLSSIRVNESSWLVPGASFAGSQSASIASGERVFVHHPNTQDNRRDSPPPINRADLSVHLSVTTSAGRRYTPERVWDTAPHHRRSHLLPADSLEGDCPSSWPVSVTIDTLDLSSMTLTGTMSASQIRDKRSPTGESSSTTYFDGEIIDFKTHSLQTENFESEGIETDVLYWMKIGPFKGMQDEDEVADNLLRQDWIKDVLMKDWILMRWKERSFVPPTPSPNPGGISIRGFYYIALNRQTGEINGSYGNHPESQPYQRLILEPDDAVLGKTCAVRKWWPAYEMR